MIHKEHNLLNATLRNIASQNYTDNTKVIKSPTKSKHVFNSTHDEIFIWIANSLNMSNAT